jgi:hypothetical protein
MLKPMRRLGVWVLLGVVIVGLAAPAASADSTFDPVSGVWERHGVVVTVRNDGVAVAEWRMYRWCGPDVDYPCDQIIGNEIVAGGRANIRLAGPDDSGAFVGTVFETTDPDLLDLGTVSLRLLPDDMALLEQGELQLTLCGEHVAEVAPPAAIQSCGA